jgi:hypothetical protein
VIVGIGLAFGTAILVVVVRVRHLRAENETGAEAKRKAEDGCRRADEEARLGTDQEGQNETDARRAEEERIAAEREARCHAEQARQGREQEARRGAERKAQGQAEEARPAEEEARATAEREPQREAEEDRQRAEEEAHLAAKSEAQRHGVEVRRDEEEVRAAAEQQAGRRDEAEAAQHASDLEGGQGNDIPELGAPVKRQTIAPGSSAADTTPQELSAGGVPGLVLEAAGGVVSLPPGRAPARRRAPQYRPPSGAASVSRQPPTAARRDGLGANGEEETATTTRGLPIEVRVLFVRGGCCRVTLLPKRRAGCPEECVASSMNGEALELVALEEEWYQDVVPENLDTILRDGTVWATPDNGQEWTLAGREIFVLAAGTTHRGFVSCPRLTLGREHVVLCKTTRLVDVEGALESAGCARPTVLRSEDGTPLGWGLVSDVDRAGQPRGLVPTVAVSIKDGGDILDVLRPLPEIEISLEGGVPLGYSSWLAGFPPAVRVRGDAQHVQHVLIDGNEATLEDNGTFSAPGWDDPGTHQVWCSNMSRGYSLVRLERSWEHWPAYVFSSAGGNRLGICGPLVRPLAAEDILGAVTGGFEAGSVPHNNPILLGAIPGQVFVAIARRDVRGARCLACPPFEPVWALPAHSLRCDKASCRILLMDSPDSAATPGGVGAGQVSQWCSLILDASRKGLSVEPAEGRELWNQYRRFARNLWKKTR